MASSVQAYSVTITNHNTNAAPSDGFIDNKRLESYNPNLQTTSLTTAQCQAKRRGNVRWNNIIAQLGLVANCYVPLNTIVSNATVSAEATSFAFQIYAEHGDASLITADELNAGSFLKSTACVVRCIGRALIVDLFQEIDIFNPTTSMTLGTLGATNAEVRWGTQILPGPGNPNIPTGAATTGITLPFEIGPYETSLTNLPTYVTVALK